MITVQMKHSGVLNRLDISPAKYQRRDVSLAPDAGTASCFLIQKNKGHIGQIAVFYLYETGIHTVSFQILLHKASRRIVSHDADVCGFRTQP